MAVSWQNVTNLKDVNTFQGTVIFNTRLCFRNVASFVFSWKRQLICVLYFFHQQDNKRKKEKQTGSKFPQSFLKDCLTCCRFFRCSFTTTATQANNFTRKTVYSWLHSEHLFHIWVTMKQKSVTSYSKIIDWNSVFITSPGKGGGGKRHLFDKNQTRIQACGKMQNR